MPIRRAMIVILAVMLALGSMSVAAQRPGHDVISPASPEATPIAGDATFVCGDIETYTETLTDVLESPGPFMEFVFSDIAFEELSASEAEEIIEDGDLLIAELGEIEVPAPYQPGHDGIVAFLQTIIDYARFYAIDSSQVPDILAYDRAMTGIYRGEVALAEACPDEIDDLGGYVFFDPATLEDEYGDE